MKWIKKLMTAMIFLMLISVLDICGSSNCFTYVAKAVTFDDINNPEVFLKQINGDKQCTLVATTMMLRRAAMMSGNTGWADITVEEVMKQAWMEGQGLKYTFTYAGITVNKATFGSDPVNESISLLNLHPEGIVLYDQIRSPRSHAVLLTDYTNGIFYSADPAEVVPSGRIPASSALVQVKDAEFYWYVSSPSIPPSLPSVTEENGIIPTIIPTIDINTYSAAFSQTSFTYDGTEKTPAVTIAGLTEKVDYTVSYFNNVLPGSGSVIITGMGVYSGTITKSFEITDASVLDPFDEIKIVIAKPTIKRGETATINVTLPDTIELVKEYSGNQLRICKEVKISYISDNKKIASVNSNGKIAGKKKGSAKIYVTTELVDGTLKLFILKIKVK